ncbi:hypothetical protein MBR110_29905 (plasmid) [Burkholderia sp. MBR-1]|nr:hypothetical protein MBR110_29905 [Burkholderia sp. MBR-1]
MAATAIAEGEKAGYSDLMVLSSAAGFYVGTTYTGPDGFEEPGSRDSDYFRSEEEAERHLSMIQLRIVPTRLKA